MFDVGLGCHLHANGHSQLIYRALDKITRGKNTPKILFKRCPFVFVTAAVFSESAQNAYCTPPAKQQKAVRHR